jgi:hypothetical protein
MPIRADIVGPLRVATRISFNLLLAISRAAVLSYLILANDPKKTAMAIGAMLSEAAKR